MKRSISKRLYVVRHADSPPGANDAARPLSKKGRKQSATIGTFLKHIDIAVDAIWQSNLIRAQQTAEIIAKKLRSKNAPVTVKGLGPDDSVAALHKRLNTFKGNLMIVGHSPSLPNLIPSLLGVGSRRQIVDLKKGGVACLEMGDSGKWVLLWCIEPNICRYFV
jgi:phosphohistidine phosphatase